MPERYVSTPFREPKTLLCPRCAKLFLPEVGYVTQRRNLEKHMEVHRNQDRRLRAQWMEDERTGFCRRHNSLVCAHD